MTLKKLRFRRQKELENSLQDAGFEMTEIFGDGEGHFVDTESREVMLQNVLDEVRTNYFLRKIENNPSYSLSNPKI